MQDGNYFIFLKARDKHTSQVASELVAVILTKGVGELTFSLFYGKTQKPAVPPEFVWEVVGYVPVTRHLSRSEGYPGGAEPFFFRHIPIDFGLRIRCGFRPCG
jgi:hypothetical protein